MPRAADVTSVEVLTPKQRLQLGQFGQLGQRNPPPMAHMAATSTGVAGVGNVKRLALRPMRMRGNGAELILHPTSLTARCTGTSTLGADARHAGRRGRHMTEAEKIDPTSGPCGTSSVVEHLSSKQRTGVRFPGTALGAGKGAADAACRDMRSGCAPRSPGRPGSQPGQRGRSPPLVLSALP